MSVLPIVKYGNDVLRRRTENVTDFDDALQRFIDDMVDTMYAAPGIGLAANHRKYVSYYTCISKKNLSAKSARNVHSTGISCFLRQKLD